MDDRILREIGFEEKEARIYNILLRLGSASASKVAAELGYDRTTTYYVLLRMLEKGHVSEVIKNNVKTFAPTKPSDILALLETRKAKFSQAIPALEKLYGQNESSFKVEVRHGKEGVRHLYRDAISSGDEVKGLGVDDSQYIELDETGLDQYYRDAEQAGVTERLITYKGAKQYGSPIATYRFIDKKYFQPTPIFIYANKVVIVSWKPTVHLVYIKSVELSTMFRKHFEALWAIAEKPK